MFAYGASDVARVEMFMYEDHDEDFGRDGKQFNLLILIKFRKLVRHMGF